MLSSDTEKPYAYNTQWKCNLPLKISLSLCLKCSFLSRECCKNKAFTLSGDGIAPQKLSFLFQRDAVNVLNTYICISCENGFKKQWEPTLGLENAFPFFLLCWTQEYKKLVSSQVERKASEANGLKQLYVLEISFPKERTGRPVRNQRKLVIPEYHKMQWNAKC